MSDYYLCDYCDNQHVKENTYEWEEMCDAGEIEPKVMHDHHGMGGRRYDEPMQVCEYYKPKGK